MTDAPGVRLLVEVPADQAERVRSFVAGLGGAAGPAAPPALELGALHIAPDAGTASIHGRDLPLTARELALLLALARRAGSFVSRRALMDEAWGGAREGSRTVDIHVRRLRTKLAPYGRAIETRVRVGYRLLPERLG